MGGFLAQPARYYPGTFSQDGLFGRYPYLLPNLVAAGGIILAIIQGMLFLEETNPRGQEEEEETSAILNTSERAPLLSNERATLHTRMGRPRNSSTISRASRFSNGHRRSLSIVDGLRQIRKKPSFLEDGMPTAIDQRFDIRRDSFGTMHSIKIPQHEVLPMSRATTESPKKTFNFAVVMLILAMTIIAYHQMAFVTNLPVYLLDEPQKRGIDFQGGLGLDLHDVGTFLAVNGLIALFTQGLIFPLFVQKVGVWRSFVSMIVVYPTTYAIVPFISALPSALVSPGVYLTLFLQGFFGIVVFPCALILLKKATPSPLVLGRVNGAAMSACCLARTVSSPMVGVVYAAGGSAASWFSLLGFAVIGVIQLICIPKEEIEAVKVESVVKDVVDDIIHPHGHPHGHSPLVHRDSDVAVED